MTSQIWVPIRCIAFEVTPNEDCRVFAFTSDGPLEVTEAGTIDTPIIYVHRSKAVIRNRVRASETFKQTSCYLSAWATGHPIETIENDVISLLRSKRLKWSIDTRIVLNSDRYVIDPYEVIIRSSGKVFMA